MKNERRAPTRPTKKPAQALIVTINKSASHVCGDCSGASPRATFTTNAAAIESIRPARHTAHAVTPANNARPTDTSKDFQVNVFNSKGEESMSDDERAQSRRVNKI